jgi:hypothetical protein
MMVNPIRSAKVTFNHLDFIDNLPFSLNMKYLTPGAGARLSGFLPGQYQPPGSDLAGGQETLLHRLLDPPGFNAITACYDLIYLSLETLGQTVERPGAHCDNH